MPRHVLRVSALGVLAFCLFAATGLEVDAQNRMTFPLVSRDSGNVWGSRCGASCRLAPKAPTSLLANLISLPKAP
jgi:hypothetical protein